MIAEVTELLLSQLVLFVLVLTRLSTLLLAMPAIGVGVPMRVRALLAISLTVLLLPVVGRQVDGAAEPAMDNLIELATAIAREAMVGLLIGTVVQLLVTGLQLAGEVASNTGSMQLGDGADPTTRANVPTLARLIGLLVTVLFIVLGGHRLLLQALLDSFDSLAPGHVSFHEGMLDLVVHELVSGIQAGIRLSAPVVTALLLSNLVTGFISRTLPGLNVLAIGLNINALVILIVSSLALGSISWIFSQELSEALQRLRETW